MYKIIFSVNNNEEVWTLPHCPPDFPIPQPEQHHETYEGLSRDYRRIGTLGLRHMEWTALLPVTIRYAACLSVKLALLKNQAPPRYSNENSKYGDSTDRNILRKKDHL